MSAVPGSAVPGFLGSNRLRMPDVLQAYVCDHLDRRDLSEVSTLGHNAQDFVRTKHRPLSVFRDPRHLGRLRTYNDLTMAQRLELQFIKFKDRPIWQRAAIVAGCIFLSPVIFIYHLPKICKWLNARLLIPLYSKLVQTADLLFRRVIRPTVRFIHQKILVPIANAVKSTILSLCRIIRRVAVAAFDALHRLVSWYFANIILPTAQWIYTNILEPLDRLVLQRIQRLVEPLIEAAVKAVESILKWAFITLPRNLYLHIIRPLYQKVLVPLGNILRVILKGVCVTFPMKIYRHILTPIGHGLQALGDFSYTHLIVPLAQIIKKVSDFVVNQFVLPAVEVVKTLPDLVARMMRR